MKFNKISTLQWLIAMSLLPCAISASAKVDKAVKQEMNTVVASEKETRNKIMEDLLAQRKEIIRLADEKMFSEADIACVELIKQLEIIPGKLAAEEVVEQKAYRKKMQSRWMEDIMNKAKALAKEGKYEDAISVASTVTVIDEVNGANYCNKFIEDCRKHLKGISYNVSSDISDPDWQKYPDITNPRLNAEEKEKVISLMRKAEELLLLESFESAAETATEVLTIDINNIRAQKLLERTIAPRINRLILAAESYYQANKYEEAIKALEKIYLLDPYNIRATTLLEKTYRKVYSYASMRHAADTQALVAMGEWSWVEPIRVESQDPMTLRKAEVKLSKNPFTEKMEKIIFPKFELQDSTIFDITKELSRRSKFYNPDGKTIDIIVQVTENEKNNNPKFKKKSSVAFSNMPLSEILRYITLNFGLKYKIEDENVIVGDGIDNLILKSFSVRNDLIASILADDLTAAAEETANMGGGRGVPTMPIGGGEATADGGGAASGTINANGEKMKAFFRLRGIEFPEGASILYSQRSNNLSVRNSEDNLRKLSELLDQLMVIQTPMIMTEIKFIEINEKNYEELGFDWNFSVTEKNAAPGSKPWNFFANSKNVRFGENTALIKDINIFPKIKGTVFGGQPNLKVTVHAISQNGRSEVLSTPRLISQSGQSASIKMVSATRYPDSWEAPDIGTSNDNTSTVSFPVPDLGDDMETGIKMTVTPTVAPDNRTITLDLHPEVITYLGHVNSSYPVLIEQGLYDDEGNRIPTNTQLFDVWMPEFGYRTLDVKVKVYDGETIVLGGIVQNDVERRNDRIPFIGDIPLLGRLFQDRQETAVKTNFLIFVTARLINHNGRPLNPLDNTATPNFNY